jgi:hypothetical protein
MPTTTTTRQDRRGRPDDLEPESLRGSTLSERNLAAMNTAFTRAPKDSFASSLDSTVDADADTNDHHHHRHNAGQVVDS